LRSGRQCLGGSTRKEKKRKEKNRIKDEFSLRIKTKSWTKLRMKGRDFTQEDFF